MAASVLLMVVLKPNFGIDFTGGSLLEVEVANTSNQQLRSELQAANKEAVVQSSEANRYFVRLGPLTEAEHQEVLSILRTNHPDLVERKFDSVGPVVGEQLKKDTAVAVVVLLILIALYIAWAFRKVSEPVPSWKFGIVTLFSAFHDVLIPIGVFAILGRTAGYQIDIAFVAAMLTILGYSINDTIVVLDRTRENLSRQRHTSKSFGEIVNQSINETLGRSLNTTLTTLLPLIAIFAVGGATTRPFVLALIVGILSGAYSSIFFASPMLVLWDKWSHRKI
jgi:preprotein translocase subunit SecF